MNQDYVNHLQQHVALVFSGVSMLFALLKLILFIYVFNPELFVRVLVTILLHIHYYYSNLI